MVEDTFHLVLTVHVDDGPACNLGTVNQTVLNRGAPSHSLVEVTHTCCDWADGALRLLRSQPYLSSKGCPTTDLVVAV